MTTTITTTRKPEIVLVGYPRSGTTYLRSYFSGHSDIFWTRNAHLLLSHEEIAVGQSRYFESFEQAQPEQGQKFIDVSEFVAVGRIFKDSMDMDANVFEPGQVLSKYTGEPSPLKAAKRLKQALPDIKIIFTIRNQIDWLRSFYIAHMNTWPNLRQRRFVDFLSTIEGKSRLFAGLYHSTIETYFNLFGRENVHVMLLEELAQQREKQLTALCEFIGVEYVVVDIDRSGVNQGSGIASGKIMQISSRLGIDPMRLKKLRPAFGPLGKGMLNLLKRNVLSSNEISLLGSFYSASNYHTSILLGKDIGNHGYPL